MLSFLKSSSAKSKATLASASEKQAEQAPAPASMSEVPKSESESASSRTSHGDADASAANTPLSPRNIPLPPDSDAHTTLSPDPKDSPSQSPYGKQSNTDARRFSFRSFTFLYSRGDQKPDHKHVLTADQEHEKKARATAAYQAKRIGRPVFASSDKRAKESALIVRSLIVGGATPAAARITKAVSKPEIGRVKSQLMQPKSANKVIAHLRTLSLSEDEASKKVERTTEPTFQAPIHGVCLDATDAEAHDRHFRFLSSIGVTEDVSSSFPSVATASINSLSMMFEGMHLVNLVTATDLGLGQPGDGEGILAGAVPTAETVINGIEQITPQLMALGFATGKAVLPDHTGVYPPNDRISVLTYWWGLEVVLPPSTLSYLNSASSISNAVINFLTALSVINNGVREVLPFVRYIGQFIDFEFDSIKKENKGKGVVCAATWIMPAAMVPRPWDFPPPPPPKVVIHESPTEENETAPAGPTSDTPRPSSTYSNETDEESDLPNPIPSSPPVLPELVVGSPPSGSAELHTEPEVL
ncbi:hypothetical protein BV22DRAFT_565395 [Leucogyrophana mollusca]|uniref:Uncharacterized protein n=1 Tax=Leucogyrophana mollusca TaxID=85980 RepID=A0ACB8BER4_9AGAM|nr:hypothetical protein BV22DRAFT_565395 [Leucogyrophana mollusca]